MRLSPRRNWIIHRSEGGPVGFLETPAKGRGENQAGGLSLILYNIKNYDKTFFSWDKKTAVKAASENQSFLEVP
jgi:hypothetical protein